MSKMISESEFQGQLEAMLANVEAGCVTGPGRSGAIAAAYASHYLGVPFLPFGQLAPRNLLPVLIVDTAKNSGRTLRRAMRQYKTEKGIALFEEPPRIKFWYEVCARGA